MKSYRSRKSGFTLVEILIVVIILGILAAIVIPQFTNASEDARKSSLVSQLQTLRSQVELYKLQHRDQYPTDGGSVGDDWVWEKLTGTTTEDGDVDPAGVKGPYLQTLSINALNSQNGVGFAPGAGIGWVIDANGKLFATGKDSTLWFDEITNEDSVDAPTGFVAVGG
jgi:general secretion pathway protein G